MTSIIYFHPGRSMMQTFLPIRFFPALLLLCLPIVAAGQDIFDASFDPLVESGEQKTNAADSALNVHRGTRGQPVKQRYEFLSQWVLPSEDRSGFRLALDFTPVNPAPPYRVLQPADVLRLENAKTNGIGRVQVGGSLVSPAIDLIEAARELNLLKELQQRIESAPATDEQQERHKSALLALVDMARGDIDAASERIRKLSDQYDQEGSVVSDLRQAETLVCLQGLDHPELYDEILKLSSSMSEREALPGERQSNREAWNRQIAALVGTIRHLSTQKQNEEVGPDLSNWLPVSRVTARTRGQGRPLAQWSHTQNSVTKFAGHEEDFLYYSIPLRGNFEVECDITGRGWQDIDLLVAGYWVAPSYDMKSYHLGNARHYMSNTPLSPTLAPFDDWVRYRVAVRDGVCTTWCNGRLIHRQPLEPEHDPWLAVRCPWYAVGSVRSLRITGTPEIPHRMAIAATTDLSGWKSYYDRQVGGGAPWIPASVLRGVFGRLQREMPEDSAESLLYYHRPLLEDGTIEYEFFYREGETLVHPAVDRLVFMLEPQGVSIHWATDGKFDRTSADPRNVTDEPENRRGPDPLPLKKDAWNRLQLKLSGDTVDLILNDELIYQRELEPDNQRLFGFFHFADQTEVRVQNVFWRGDWPQALPPIGEQELAGAATVEVDRKLAGLEATVRHDFSDDGLPRDRFAVQGDEDNSRVAAKADGLHVDHPGIDGYSNSSVAVQLQVHGNFEITASFENFGFTPGESGSSGISLTAILENDGFTHGSVHRGALVEDGKLNRQFAQAEFMRTPGDKPLQTWHGTTSEESTSGRLRLSRVGETLYCQLAENDSPYFRLIHSEKFGPENLLLGGIRLTTAVHSRGDTPGKTSVIWKDLTIRAERITEK